MRWFGESWAAPVCDPEEHIDTPVDLPCYYCQRLIDEGDQGLELPSLAKDASFEDIRIVVTFVYIHRDCMLRAVLPEGYERSGPPV